MDNIIIRLEEQNG